VAAGVRLAASKDFGGAYASFTEAIRLSPTRAAYHANRSAAALQLKNYAGAAHDAEHALRLCPTHIQAHMRAAKAYMSMRRVQVRSMRPDERRGTFRE
jgi:regulator of sirC expression with transglutaminase-like and TPR domain